jgi:hypothetical protein
MSKNDTIRIKIDDIIRRIETFGHIRHINRINKDTKELEDLFFSFNPIEILQDELTVDEEKLLEYEKNIVIPQIQYKLYDILNHLVNDNSSRQAIIYNPMTKDVFKFPCLSVFHFLITDNELNLKVFIRSSDVKKNLFVDCWFLSEMLKTLTDNLKIKMGRITLFLSSVHIYE